MSEQTMTAAERFRQMMQKRPVEIVDVSAPSGFVYKFQKPSKFALLFGAGELPQNASSEATESWIQDGLIDYNALSKENKNKLGKKVFELRDKVLFLSHEPKLVVGEAQNENEISTDEVPDEDLAYLFKWVAAGGDEAAMLQMFPEGRGQHAFLGSHSKKQRRKTK